MIYQLLIDGLVPGILYSLLALGFSLVYKTTRIFHIALPAIFIITVALFWGLAAKFNWPIISITIIAILVATITNILCNKWVYRPLGKRGGAVKFNTLMIALIVMITLVVDIAAFIYGVNTKAIGSVTLSPHSFGNISVTTPQIYQIVMGAIGIIAVCVFCSLLKSDKPEEKKKSASRTWVFLLSGLIIGLSACLNVWSSGMSPHAQMTVILNAVAVMLIGNILGMFGYISGGIVLGILQSLTVSMLSSNWQNIIAYIVIALFLFVFLHKNKQNCQLS